MLTPQRKVGKNAPRLVLRNGRLWRDMKFTLTYDGELLSASDKHTRVKNKNEIRFELADQIAGLYTDGDFARFGLGRDEDLTCGRVYSGIIFIPLVSRQMNASCRLAIKFMRNERPGEIVHGGDLDNRIKTLLDALRMPQHGSEVLKSVAPEWVTRPHGEEQEGICPCLLEDDSLVTELVLESATIMTRLPKNHVRLVIEVELRPFDFRTG